VFDERHVAVSRRTIPWSRPLRSPSPPDRLGAYGLTTDLEGPVQLPVCLFGLRRRCIAALWPRLSPACPSCRPRERPSCVAGMQGSWGKTRDLLIPCTRRIYAFRCSMTFGLRTVSQPRPLPSPLCGSCSSGRDLPPASSPPPPHGSSSCLRLGVPVIRPPGDFHPQVTSRSAFASRLPASSGMSTTSSISLSAGRHAQRTREGVKEVSSLDSPAPFLLFSLFHARMDATSAALHSMSLKSSSSP